MSTGNPHDLKVATQIGEKLIEYLEPACHRITLAGSIRRQTRRVNDVELLLCPKRETVANGLFGTKEVSAIDAILADLEKRDVLERVKGGEKYKQYIYKLAFPHIKIDLWTAFLHSWGFQLAIRTGPWQLSKRMVTQRCKNGLLHDDYKCEGGSVWTCRGNDPADSVAFDIWQEHEDAPPAQGIWNMYPTPDEQDFFKLIDGGYIPPERRRYA